MRFLEVDKRWEHSGNLCWLTTVQLARSTLYFLYNQREKGVFHANMYLNTFIIFFYQFYVIVSGCWEKTLCTKLTFFSQYQGIFECIHYLKHMYFYEGQRGTNTWEKNSHNLNTKQNLRENIMKKSPPMSIQCTILKHHWWGSYCSESFGFCSNKCQIQLCSVWWIREESGINSMSQM